MSSRSAWRTPVRVTQTAPFLGMLDAPSNGWPQRWPSMSARAAKGAKTATRTAASEKWRAYMGPPRASSNGTLAAKYRAENAAATENYMQAEALGGLLRAPR